jgi:hypothetical protein
MLSGEEGTDNNPWRIRVLTYSLQLGFELCEVLAVRDPEVPVNEFVLRYAVCRVFFADGEDRCRAVRAPRLPDFADVMSGQA